MTPERRDVLVDFVAERLGSVRMWRLVILCGIGLPLLLAVVVILVGVYVDGAATADDIGLPAVFVVGLTPIVVGGFLYGIAGVRALRRHELLLALRATPPGIARVERVRDGHFTATRFHLPSGGAYTIWMDAQTVEEMVRWLGG